LSSATDIVDLVRALIAERAEHVTAVTRIDEKLKQLREIVNAPAPELDGLVKKPTISLQQVWTEHTRTPPLRAKHIFPSLPIEVYERRILAALAAREPLTVSELHALNLGPKQTLGKTLLSMVQRGVLVVRHGVGSRRGRGKAPYLYARPNLLMIQEVSSAIADPG
jgi:hypothetical protein